MLDTSVVLRMLFGESGALEEWNQIADAHASRLLIVEVGRVIDRCRLAGDLDDAQVEGLHREARRVLRSVEILELTDVILVRAASAMPTTLGTLDAIHLATALELARTVTDAPVLATHDAQLARAARASGIEVIGA